MSPTRCAVCGKSYDQAGILITDNAGTRCLSCRDEGMIETPCERCGEMFMQPYINGKVNRLYCSGICRNASAREKNADADKSTRLVIGTWRVGKMHRSVVLINKSYRCQCATETDDGYDFAEPVWFPTKDAALAWVRGEE